ncbi:hypothetical protein JW964_24380, partial [candidate division KSB1 bacterium]|nr:hypothetical protein [candidate division KSB1 bacterium]
NLKSDLMIRFKKLYAIFITTLLLCLTVHGQNQNENKPVPENSNQEQLSTQKKLEQLLSNITTAAKKQTDSTVVKSDNIEIDGLIIDQTITKIGHEFYENFYTLWEAPPEIKDYSIYVIEKATMLSTSQVWINVDDMTIYQIILKPRAEEIEEAVRIGIEITLQFLHQYEQDKKLLDDEDMVGSGIF